MRADADRRTPSLILLSTGLLSALAVVGIVIAAIVSVFRYALGRKPIFGEFREKRELLLVRKAQLLRLLPC